MADGGAGTHIIDIEVISNPFIDDTFVTGGFANKVALTPTHIYVADGEEGVQIIDRSDYSLTTVDTYDNALSIELQGNYAYVANDTEGLTIIDISTPSSAYVKNTCDTPGNALDVTVVDNFAYISVGTEGIVEINVADPIPFISIKNSSIMEAVCIVNKGNYIYVVDGADNIAPIKIFYRNPNTPNMNYVDMISLSSDYSNYISLLPWHGDTSKVSPYH